MKKKKKVNYRKEAIDLAKQIAKERDNYTCIKCSRSKSQGWKIDASHIIPVSGGGITVCDIRNIFAMCATCHRWWHDNPFLASRWFETTKPGLYEELSLLNRSVVIPNFRELYKSLKSRTKNNHP